MLQAHTLKPARGSRHKIKRIGRGNASGHGTYSTRGGKGQTARSGGSRGVQMLGFRHILLQTPKLRGFKSFHERPVEVYLRDLNMLYQAGEEVNLNTLREKGLISTTAKAAKVVATGELTKKLALVGVAATSGAAEKIKAAGGEVR